MNIFLSGEDRDIETAIMYEQAVIHDIGKAIAFTDGVKTFINTDDNLFSILPNYSHKMLKWLLWHERYHKELRHHNRYFKYIEDLRESELIDKFSLTKDEVNIIMDILVHDSLSRLFPELINIAISNFAQMRHRNSLKYTFKTNTLEEMLNEYKEYKKDEDTKGEGEGEGEETDECKDGEGAGTGTSSDKDEDTKSEPPTTPPSKTTTPSSKKGHAEGGSGTEHETTKEKAEDGEPEVKSGATEPDIPESEHDKTDWTKLEDIDNKEFISSYESDEYMRQIERLRKKKFRLGRITETLNGLATTTRQRTYAKPNPVRLGGGAVLKGSRPGYAKLYLVFDASGSMGDELETFKEIISKSVPQAMNTPCEWFTRAYRKGKFKDIMRVRANDGYDDDGDRVIELCWQAEQQGYSPIGVTDGGGRLSWSKEKLKELRRTILVGQNEHWLAKVREVNPRVQTLDI